MVRSDCSVEGDLSCFAARVHWPLTSWLSGCGSPDRVNLSAQAQSSSKRYAAPQEFTSLQQIIVRTTPRIA
jgi:hypothetical protein